MFEPFHPILRPTSKHEFKVSISSAWYQGKGAYGGMIFAYFVLAFEHCSPLQIRSLQVELCQAATEGTAYLSVQTTRKGSRTTFLRATLYTEGGTLATASAVMGHPRETQFDTTTLSFPEVKPHQDVRPLPNSPIMPKFCQNLLYRPCLGPLPFSRAPHQPVGLWIDFKESRCTSPSATIAALIDAGWPSILIHVPKPRALGTVSISIQFFSPSSPPFLLCSQTINSTEGHISEQNALWSSSGDLVAHAQQLIVLY